MQDSILYFDVMDISAETKKLLDSIEDQTTNMQSTEKAAYEMGVHNTLAALKVILSCGENHPLHYDGVGNIIEMSSFDIMQMIEDSIMEILSEED